MKREEKNRQSREKILDAAVAEFGAKGYEAASLNCAVNSFGISKGLVYHYFADRDELYLACVKGCFDKLAERIRAADCDKLPEFTATVKKYFKIRNDFFAQNPDLCKIFFEAVLQPPVHLKEKISGLKKEFADINLHLIQSGLDRLRLRDGVSIQDAIEYFLTVAESFNYEFYQRFDKMTGREALIKQHELKLQKTLDIILFGLVDPSENQVRQSRIHEETP